VLDCDKQCQRILVSFFDGLESELTVGVATEPFSVTLQEELKPLITGEYAQRILQDELELKREIARRTEKLNGGRQR
jgi:hypothetical protein